MDLDNEFNVESFNLDHTKVKAPYIRLVSTTRGEHGDIISKFDLRFTQPNLRFMEMTAVHALEHLLAVNIREYLDNVVDISPMGCQTGFYLLVLNLANEELVYSAVEKTLKQILEAEEVPAANELQCGNAASHSLSGAKKYAKDMLDRSAEWKEIF